METPCRSVNIVDSRVGLGAVAKGRSSSHKLNGVLRSFIPYSVAGQKSVVDIWGATDEKVADDPTRHKIVREPDPEAVPWLRTHYGDVPVCNYSISHACAGDGDGLQAALEFHESVHRQHSKRNKQYTQPSQTARNRNNSYGFVADDKDPQEGAQCNSKLGYQFFNQPAHAITSAPERALHQVDDGAVCLNNYLTSHDSCLKSRGSSNEMFSHVPLAMLTPSPSCGNPGVRDDRLVGGPVGIQVEHVPGTWRSTHGGKAELPQHAPKHICPVRYFKEIFSGCGHLSKAFKADGSWKVLDPVDAYPKGGAYRAADDMLKREVV